MRIADRVRMHRQAGSAGRGHQFDETIGLFGHQVDVQRQVWHGLGDGRDGFDRQPQPRHKAAIHKVDMQVARPRRGTCLRRSSQCAVVGGVQAGHDRRSGKDRRGGRLSRDIVHHRLVCFRAVRSPWHHRAKHNPIDRIIRVGCIICK